MQTYSIVFLDIDGMLLDSRHQIIPQTKQLLNRLERQGIPIILCSARSPGGVDTVTRQAGLRRNPIGLLWREFGIGFRPLHFA